MGLNEIPGQTPQEENPFAAAQNPDVARSSSGGWLQRGKSSVSSVLNGQAVPKVKGKVLFAMMAIAVAFVLFLVYQKFSAGRAAKAPKDLPASASKQVPQVKPLGSQQVGAGSVSLARAAIEKIDQEMAAMQPYLTGLEARAQEWQAYAKQASDTKNRPAYDQAAAEYGKIKQVYDEGVVRYERLAAERRDLVAQIDNSAEIPGNAAKMR